MKWFDRINDTWPDLEKYRNEIISMLLERQSITLTTKSKASFRLEHG